jgi:hypothetical protein
MPPNTLDIFQSEVTVNGQIIPVNSWGVHVGTYGQIGRVECVTSLKAMREYGLDDLSGLAPDTYTPLALSFNAETVFGGTYFAGNPTYDEDLFSFFGRDYAAILFDTKRSIASLNLDNVTVSDLVRQLAQEYGLDAQVNIDNDPLVGTVVTEGSTMATYPQPIWNLIVYLARMTGAEVYTTPQNVLTFQSIGQDDTQHTVTWKALDALNNQNALNAPVLKLRALHQPQRNKQFAVVVRSHHQKTTQTNTATVTINGEDIALPGTKKTLRAGFYTGSAGANARGILSNRGLGLPVYEFREDGLTPDLAQARAEGYAREIAKRLYIWTAVVDGNPLIRPTQRITVEESEAGSLFGLNANNLYITGVMHTLETPQGEEIGGDGEGYLTTITAMSIPPPAGGMESLGELL